VSLRAKKRGLPQLGTLGAGNHYCEVQVVEEIYNKFAAEKMGVTKVGQIVIFIHSGSRGIDFCPSLYLLDVMFPFFRIGPPGCL